MLIPKLRKSQEADMALCLRTFCSVLDSYWIKFYIEADKWLADEVKQTIKEKKK